MSEVEIRVRAKSEASMRLEAKSRQFTVVVDEPERAGGADEGPHPLEYLLASLCGCLNVLGQMVAKEMNIALSTLEFTATGTLDPGMFLGRSNANRAGFAAIDVAVDVASDAEESTLDEWLQRVEARCPVSDNLQSPTPVTVRLANSS
jgi:uncharacterized OsmC-like protein